MLNELLKKTIIDVFLENVRLYPENPAVMDARGAYTYNRLNRRSALLARKILDAIGDGDRGNRRVAVLLPRSREYMTGMLAVIRAGCALVPLDSEYPAERIQAIQEDSEFRLFVTTAGLAEKTGGIPKLLIEEAIDEKEEKEAEIELNLSRPELEGLLVYTSGSTGKPKGVVHRQSVFCHYFALNKLANRPLPTEAIHLCMAGFTFIAALFDLTIPIMTGAQVYIADEKERQNMDLLWAIIQKRHVTSMFLPPKMFMVMRELYGRLPLRNVELGGEKASPKYADDGNLFEAFASSETFCMLFRQIHTGDQRELGKPAAGSRIYLIDDDGTLITEPGKLGEMCVASPWLANGYNKLPEDTAAKFTDCPFEPGQRMYRTGDYMAFDAEGNYYYHGRKDRMIKLRGFRVELGEIENVMRRKEGISELACITVKVNGGDKLCRYYAGEKMDSAVLKEHAASFLPYYMVPDYFVWMDALPRNERNKVNYLALKAMDPPTEEGDYAPPETETEKKVCEAFETALNLTRVSVTADFFALGGTSLSVAVLVAALTDVYAGLSFQDVVRHPTPRSLAAYILEAPEKERDLLKMDRDFYPLTKTQMGIYLEGLTGGNNATYTIPFLIRTDSSVTADSLAAAVKKVVAAHPSMKYMIRAGADGIPHMFMVPTAPVDITVTDGTEDGRLAFMEHFMPVVPMMDQLLFHFAVYRTPERCYLAVKTHLIFLDGTSVSLMIEELNKALAGEALQPEAFTIQQAAMREEQMMRDGSYETAKLYHTELFKAMDGIPSMAGDRDGALTPGVSENMRYEPHTLSAERVKAFCEKNQVTESSFFMGAMALLLSKYLNSSHVSFSTVYNGRAQAGMETTIGTLIKRIPVYGDLSRDLPVAEYLQNMGKQILSNMSHDIYSFDEVLKECPVNEEVEFIYQGNQFTDHPEAETALAEGDKWFIEHYHTGMVTGCFSIQFFSTDGWYNMTIEYRNERFSPEWVRRFAGYLFTIAEGLLTKETIGQIAMLTDEDREMLDKFNDTRVPTAFVPVHEQIHRHALKTPERMAVTAAGKTLTFRELDLLSGRIAAALKTFGVKAETLVGVLFDREVWAYAAEIGILKANGAFVPFIPEYPDERIDFCMKDGQIPLLLTTAALKAGREGLNGGGYRIVTLEDIFGTASLDEIRAEDEEPVAEDAFAAAGAGSLAYCIYTSGTTGRPKGVMIEHGNIANYVLRNEKSVEIIHYAEPGRICLALASFSFDVSVVEEFVPLCNGNGVVIATEQEIHTPSDLAALIKKTGVTGITCTPTYLLSLLDIHETREAIKQLTFFDIGAEAFPAQLYGRLRELNPESVILNVYGPTEATMGCAAEVMTGSEEVTIGKPIANTVFQIADSFGNGLPVGIRGELVICGDQVGRGYINLPDKTASAFFRWNGMRAYHSGDLAAWTPNGTVRLFGRVDNQIKLRGFRIELDEIEKVMSEYPGIKTVAAAVKKANGTEYLVGYYTAQKEADPNALKQYMHGKLPDYMVPTVLMQVEAMPMTSSGKVDRRALPMPDFSVLRAEYVAPANEAEVKICHAFAQALNLPENQVGALDDFFELGGDSLKAMGAMAEAELEGLTAADIFQKRTPRAIAAAVAERSGMGSLDEREEAARKVPHALTPLQLQMVDTQMFRPGSTMWSNTHFLVRFDPEEVNADRLCKAVNEALANHPALSSAIRFSDEGELVQQYVPGLLPEVKVQEIMQETADALPDVLVLPFDRIFDSCLCRVGVFRSPKHTYLFMDVHHMLMDGASLGILLADITNAFYGRPLSRDYFYAMLEEEEKRIAAGSREQDHDWFRERYGDEVWCNMPPAQKGGNHINQAGREKRLQITAEQVKAAEDFWGVSHSVMAITAALITLSRTTGKQHVMINWIFNNRLAPESEGAVGMLIKNLPAAARMEEFSSVRELLQDVKSQVAEGIAHCTYDFMTENYRAYLDDCMEVNLQLGINGNELEVLHPKLVELNDVFKAAGARLELELLENEYRDGGFDSEMEYAEGLFDPKEMEKFHDLYIQILEDLVHQKEP